MDARQQRTVINPLAWVLWLVAVASVAAVTRNPLYLTLDLLTVVAVYLSLPRHGSAAHAWRLFATVGVTLSIFSIGFNVLTVHAGDRVFATLPEALPIIGGQLTWNAFVYGVLSALAISTLLIAAATFNTAVRQGDLIRLMPASFASLGIAGSIALTMVPQTIATARDIYDAQRSRGHRYRRPRDARSFIVPLLATGLERALVLSEALETRGFGASAASGPNRSRRVAVIGAAAMLLLALGLLGLGQLSLGLAAMAGAVALALLGAPRRGRRSRYHPLEWNTASILVAVTAAFCPLVIVLLTTFTGMTTAYDTFPRLAAPPFDPIAGATILLLIAPVAWAHA